MKSWAVHVLKRYVSLMHWFVPERFLQRPLELSRAQNVISAAVIAGVSDPLYALLYRLLGFDSASYVILACGAVMLSAPLILKLTGIIKIAEEVFVCAVFCLFTWLTYHLGGVTAPTSAWLIICPVVAMLLGGVLTGIFWLVVSSSAIVFIYLLQYHGVPMPVSPIKDPLLLQSMCVIGLFIVVVIFVLFFELTKTQGFVKLEEALKTIQELAIRDELTGTHNRRHLLKLIEDEKARASRLGQSFCVCLLDIDHFKRINDTYGHSVGDSVLKTFAQTVQASIRKIDSFGRYGGEEFLLMLPQTTLDGAFSLAEKVRVGTEQMRFAELADKLTVTVSIGIAEYLRGENIAQTIARADQALYQAKSSGRNRIIRHDSDFTNEQVVSNFNFSGQMSEESPITTAESQPIGDALPSPSVKLKDFLHFQPEIVQFILNSMPSAVVVINSDGETLLANPTAQRLIFSHTAPKPIQQWPNEYGLFLPDEVTHYPADSLPLAKAVRGESVNDAEIFIRNPNTLSAVWVQASASPIKDDSGGVLGGVAVFHDITAQKGGEGQSYLSQFDALTGLPNRHIFRDRLNHAMHRAIRNQNMIALMILDVNKFKEFNDALGYEKGDWALIHITERIKGCLRDCDTISRWDGDEFIIILEDIHEEESACLVAQKILDEFSMPLLLDDAEYFLSFSIGITLFPIADNTIDGLLKKAGIAMQQAKTLGQNTYVVYATDMSGGAIERLTLKNQLRHALSRNELFLHYQPQVDIHSQEIIGVEALLRWQHPELGLVSPAQFIPLAEETGLIISIGEWVLKTACAQNKAWQDSGLPAIKTAVNLSARQLKHSKLVDSIRSIVQETGIDPTCLELEITEGLLIENLHLSKEVISKLRAMGIKISIDDFGTGYSSLSYLSELPLDILKMDGSFVKPLEEQTSEKSSHSIAEAIIAMAHNLNLRVIAEAVETETQLSNLRKMRCDQMQGYFFSRPVPPVDIEKMLKRQAQNLKRDLA